MKQIRFEGTDLPQGQVNAEDLRAVVAAALSVAVSEVGVQYMPETQKQTLVHYKNREPEERSETIPAHLIVTVPDNYSRGQVAPVVASHTPTASAETRARERAAEAYDNQLKESGLIKGLLARVEALERRGGP